MQFTSEETRAFAYYDGAKTVYADPLAFYRKILIATRGKPNELSNRVFAVKPNTTDIEKLMDSWEAAEQLVALVREVFSMQPFVQATGQGARDEHCWAVWDDFCAFMSDEKKNPETTQTSTPPTVSPTISGQPTPSTSASS